LTCGLAPGVEVKVTCCLLGASATGDEGKRPMLDLLLRNRPSARSAVGVPLGVLPALSTRAGLVPDRGVALRLMCEEMSSSDWGADRGGPPTPEGGPERRCGRDDNGVREAAEAAAGCEGLVATLGVMGALFVPLAAVALRVGMVGRAALFAVDERSYGILPDFDVGGCCVIDEALSSRAWEDSLGEEEEEEGDRAGREAASAAAVAAVAVERADERRGEGAGAGADAGGTAVAAAEDEVLVDLARGDCFAADAAGSDRAARRGFLLTVVVMMVGGRVPRREESGSGAVVRWLPGTPNLLLLLLWLALLLWLEIAEIAD
jgi:hypothetical protein